MEIGEILIASGGFAAVLALILLYFRGKRVKEENYYLAIWHQLMETHYEAIRDQMERERRFRHDIRNHMQTLEYLIKKPKGQEKIYQQYEQDLEDMSREYIIREWTDNAVVNVALHNKICQCRREGIRVKLWAETEKIQDYDEMAVVTALYNLFDNAIEASRYLEEGTDKYLNIKLQEEDKGLLFSFENPKARSYEPEKGERTVKADKKNHGLGLVILKEMAEKNHGSLELQKEDTRFLVKLYLGKEG